MAKSGGWELASGVAKETPLAALFKGASVVGRDSQPVSVVSTLRDRTVLLYFAAGRVESCRSFNSLLTTFYDIIREADDSIAVIFVSNDKSKEEQLAFFRDGGMHADWLMVEFTYDLQDIMDTFKVEKIPQLTVVSRDGRAVVEDARDQVLRIFLDERGRRKDEATVRIAVAEQWGEWRRLAGDWRAIGGQTLGGSPSAGGAGSSAAPAPQAASGNAAQSEREALRAARLAALERRASGNAAVGFEQATPGSAAAAPAAAMAPPSAQAHSGPRIATIGGGASSSLAGASGGSGTFAGQAACAAPATGGYTLSGGRVVTPQPAPPSAAGFSTTDILSDMASDGAESVAASAESDVDMDVAVSSLVAMGFPEDRAREALQASRGDVDGAVALLVEGA